MNIIIRKNLIAHKKRNNLTAIIYSLTLGTVIFILMQLRQEFALLSYIHGISDATFSLEAKNYEEYGWTTPYVDPRIITPILVAHEESIDEWAYYTRPLSKEWN
jgi:hypothetical protein